MHSGVGAIDDVDVAAIVYFHVIRLNRDFAFLIRALANAALVGLIGYGGDEISDFLRIVRVTNIDGAQAGIEMGDENDALVVNRRHALVRGMRAEATATAAEVAAGFGHGPRRDAQDS